MKLTKDADYIKEYAQRWLHSYIEHQDASIVLNRFCRFKDIPEDVLESIIYWCKKYSDLDEVLYTLSYLLRHQIFNEKIASKWLIDLISNWIKKSNLRNDDIGNLESIMFYITRNYNFSQEDDCIDLYKKWFISEHSFRTFKLYRKLLFLCNLCYFKKYYNLLIEKRIDFATDEEKIKKFLNWVNKWSRPRKKKIKSNLIKLKIALPQYNHLWNIVQFE